MTTAGRSSATPIEHLSIGYQQEHGIVVADDGGRGSPVSLRDRQSGKK